MPGTFSGLKSTWSVAKTTALILVTAAATPEASLKAGSHFIDRKMLRVVTDPYILHSIPELQAVRLSPKITYQCHAQTAKSKPEPNLSSLQVLTLPCNITACLALWTCCKWALTFLKEQCPNNDKAPQHFFLLGAATGLTTRWQDKVKKCTHRRKHSWAYFLSSTNVFQMSQLLFVSNCLKHGSIPSNNKLLVFNL